MVVEGKSRHAGRLCCGCGAIIGNIHEVMSTLEQALEAREMRLRQNLEADENRKLKMRMTRLWHDAFGKPPSLTQLTALLEAESKRAEAANQRQTIEAAKRKREAQLISLQTAHHFKSSNDAAALAANSASNGSEALTAVQGEMSEASDNMRELLAAHGVDEDKSVQLKQQRAIENRIAVLQNAPKLVCGIAKDLGFSSRMRLRPERNFYRGVWCKRCKLVRNGDLVPVQERQKEIPPEYFTNQLTHLQSRRALILKVVDALAFDDSWVNNLRDFVGANPVALVVSRCDLVVDPGDDVGLDRFLRWCESRVRSKGFNCIAKFAVSGRTGMGITRLADWIAEHVLGRSVFVIGAPNVGKSTLVNALKRQFVINTKYHGPRGRARKRLLSEAEGILVSPLAGTTLRSIRVPIFRSPMHALWDTPGIPRTAKTFPSTTLADEFDEARRAPPSRREPLTFVLTLGEILVVGPNLVQLEIEPHDGASSASNVIEVCWSSAVCRQMMRIRSRAELDELQQEYPRISEKLRESKAAKRTARSLIAAGHRAPLWPLKMGLRVEADRLDRGWYSADINITGLGFFSVRARNNYFKVSLWGPRTNIGVTVRDAMPIARASPIDGMAAVRAEAQRQHSASPHAAESVVDAAEHDGTSALVVSAAQTQSQLEWGRIEDEEEDVEQQRVRTMQFSETERRRQLEEQRYRELNPEFTPTLAAVRDELLRRQYAAGVVEQRRIIDLERLGEGSRRGADAIRRGNVDGDVDDDEWHDLESEARADVERKQQQQKVKTLTPAPVLEPPPWERSRDESVHDSGDFAFEEDATKLEALPDLTDVISNDLEWSEKFDLSDLSDSESDYRRSL